MAAAVALAVVSAGRVPGARGAMEIFQIAMGSIERPLVGDDARSLCRDDDDGTECESLRAFGCSSLDGPNCASLWRNDEHDVSHTLGGVVADHRAHLRWRERTTPASAAAPGAKPGRPAAASPFVAAALRHEESGDARGRKLALREAAQKRKEAIAALREVVETALLDGAPDGAEIDGEVVIVSPTTGEVQRVRIEDIGSDEVLGGALGDDDDGGRLLTDEGGGNGDDVAVVPPDELSPVDEERLRGIQDAMKKLLDAERIERKSQGLNPDLPPEFVADDDAFRIDDSTTRGARDDAEDDYGEEDDDVDF